MTQKELQDILRIQPGSVSEILTKMEEKGLIRRQKDEGDRRRSVIELTEGGHDAAVRQEQQEDGTPTFAALSEQEQEEMKKMAPWENCCCPMCWSIWWMMWRRNRM